MHCNKAARFSSLIYSKSARIEPNSIRSFRFMIFLWKPAKGSQFRVLRLKKILFHKYLFSSDVLTIYSHSRCPLTATQSTHKPNVRKPNISGSQLCEETLCSLITLQAALFIHMFKPENQCQVPLKWPIKLRLLFWKQNLNACAHFLDAQCVINVSVSGTTFSSHLATELARLRFYSESLY